MSVTVLCPAITLNLKACLTGSDQTAEGKKSTFSHIFYVGVIGDAVFFIKTKNLTDSACFQLIRSGTQVLTLNASEH